MPFLDFETCIYFCASLFLSNKIFELFKLILCLFVCLFTYISLLFLTKVATVPEFTNKSVHSISERELFNYLIRPICAARVALESSNHIVISANTIWLAGHMTTWYDNAGILKVFKAVDQVLITFKSKHCTVMAWLCLMHI